MKKEKSFEDEIRKSSKEVAAYAKRLKKANADVERIRAKLVKACDECGCDVTAFLQFNLEEITNICSNQSDSRKRRLIETALQYCKVLKEVNALEKELQEFQKRIHEMSTISRQRVVDNYGEGAALLVEALAEATRPKSVDEMITEFGGAEG